jgi:hypothetical protein
MIQNPPGTLNSRPSTYAGATRCYEHPSIIPPTLVVLIVRRIVWPIHERQMSSIQRSRWITFRLLSVFLTASKDFFQTFDENIRWFDARLHDLFELQSSFQISGWLFWGY